jgi:small subunit ribosomal protein S8
MCHSDTIADFLTRVRNATKAGHRYTDVRWSKVVEQIAETLKEALFIEHVLVRTENGKSLMRVFLKYGAKRTSVIRGLRRISSPGRRMYVGIEEIPSVMNGLGLAVLSTPQGVMSGHKARDKHVGGELLCYVW